MESPLPDAQTRLPAAAMTLCGFMPSSMRMLSIDTESLGNKSVSVTTRRLARPRSRIPGQPATAAPERKMRLAIMA